VLAAAEAPESLGRMRTGPCSRSASRVATLWKRYANAAMTIFSASGPGGPENLPVSGAWNGRSEGAKLRLRASGAGRRRLASRRPRGACSSRVFGPGTTVWRSSAARRSASALAPAPRPSHKRIVVRTLGAGRAPRKESPRLAYNASRCRLRPPAHTKATWTPVVSSVGWPSSAAPSDQSSPICLLGRPSKAALSAYVELGNQTRALRQ
jgi:hypothetical protein